MFSGDLKKDGVIIKSSEGFNLYNGLSDSSLQSVLRPRDNARVKTMKGYDTVIIANNKSTVHVHPDGNVDIIPNSQEQN